jgi:replicative DNA helicase
MSDAVDVEYVTVGALLLAPGQIEQVRAWLLPTDFDRPPCAELYELILDMSARQLPVTPISVLDELRRLGRLRGDGWPGSVIPKMVRAVPTPAAAGRYGRLVLEDALFRELEDVGRRLAQLGRDRGGIEDTLDVAAEPQRILGGLRERWSRAELAGLATAGMSDVQRAVQLRAVARLPLGRQRSR